MGFAIEKLGQWTEGPDFTVEAERTKAYAAATNDPTPAHLSGEVAPPVFATRRRVPNAPFDIRTAPETGTGGGSLVRMSTTPPPAFP